MLHLPPAHRVCIAFSLVLVSAVGFIHLRWLERSLPYPQHVDERPLVLASARVLQSGDLNPYLYSYPSLPVYLGTAALIAGTITASGHGPKAVRTSELGRFTSPYYEQVRVAGTVRKSWWAMGVTTIVATSVIALKLGGAPVMLLSAAIAGIGVGLPGRAASYINVDTPMTMFAMLCLALIVASRDPRWTIRIGAVAILCGAAIASKYTAYVLLVPCILAQWLLHERDRGWASLALIAGSVFAFAMFCPYFVLDMPGFVDGAAFENYHYRARGHSGFDLEPGWPQLRAYIRDLVGEYGVLLVVLAALGVVEALRVEPRRTLVVSSYVVVVTVMLIGYTVHFARNLLPVVALVPVFAACGLRGLSLLAAAGLRRVRWQIVSTRADWIAAGALTACVMLGAPWERLRDLAMAKADSRNEFSAWSAAQFKEPTVIVAPTQMPIDPRTLPSHLRLVALDLKDAQATASALTPGTVFLLPEWTTRTGWRGRRRAAIQPGVAAIPPHDELSRFGTELVVPFVKDEDACADPLFRVVRIR